MLQSNIAWYQLISLHPASCIAVCWRLDDPGPFPQGPPIPQGGAGYHCSIYILNLSYFPFVILFDLVFKFMILTFILVTYFSIHACLAWNQLSSSYFSIHQHSSSYPTSYIAVGRLDDPHPFPGPTHSTGGRGGWWVMTMTMAGGVGGGPGTWNIYKACLGVGVPLHKPYPYRLHRWGFLHFRYLKLFGEQTPQKEDPTYPNRLGSKSQYLIHQIFSPLNRFNKIQHVPSKNTCPPWN